MINDFKKIEDLLKEINDSIDKKINVYVIGGATLLKRQIKAATKDIDLVVMTKNEFLELNNALDKIRFISKIPGKEYNHMNLSQIFQRGEFRIDLFEKEVCKKFSVSKNMISRADKIIEFSRLNVFLCSNEDIFLFKTMTEREGDINDCISIATLQEVDWDVILKELQHQIKEKKEDVWLTWVAQRLDILEEKGLSIPIMKDIDKLRNAYFEKLEKKTYKNIKHIYTNKL